jgi:hypothetical protein
VKNAATGAEGNCGVTSASAGREARESPRTHTPSPTHSGVEYSRYKDPRVFVAVAPRPGAKLSDPCRDQESGEKKTESLKTLGWKPVARTPKQPGWLFSVPHGMTVENASLISLASHWPNKKFQGIGEETCLRRFSSSPPGASDPPPGRPHRHGLPTHTYRDGSLEIWK